MASPRWIAAGAAALVVTATLPLAMPVDGQEARRTAPKSLLPEGLDRPAAPDAPAETNTRPLLPPLVKAPAADAAQAAGQAADQPTEQAADAPDAFALPEPTGRDIAVFGPLGPNVTGPGAGYGLAAFQAANGRFLAGLLRRMELPVASRWAHILLRRALLTEAAAPAGIAPADWIAARASALLRMGEVGAAKLLIDATPIDRFSPALYRVAGQVDLAAADLGGLCPIAPTAQALSRDPLWPLALAMCAALQGDDATAARIFDELRRDESVEDFDIRLGERVATLAGGGGRAINVDWNDAPAITLYRWGVAAASGVSAPVDRLEALGPARFGWLARAANVPADVRLAALRPAAVIGVLSGNDLVSATAALGNGDDNGTPAARLRQAYAAASPADRMVAVRAIWRGDGDSGTGDGVGYGALIESANAVARIAPDPAYAADAAVAIAALLSVGAPDLASRWRDIAEGAGGEVRAQGWALLAAGSGGVEVSPARFREWRTTGKASAHRAGLLLAALDGLGEASGSEWDSLRRELAPVVANSFTTAIDAAAARGSVGAVAVLAGTGLQGRWADVPPSHLRHVIAALVRVGRGHEARMIAAEAVTRG